MPSLPSRTMLGLVIALIYTTTAHAAGVDVVTPSVGMVIALDAPKFEDFDFGKHGKIPLAIPNVRLGTGFAFSQSCQILTSKSLVHNAVAMAVRLPHLDAGEYILGSGQPAAVTMRSPNTDLAVLAVDTKQPCVPLFINTKQMPDVVVNQSLLKIGFGQHLGVYSRKLSQRKTAVTNPAVYRSQNEGKGFLIDSKTSEADAGSLLLDEQGTFAGFVSARTKEAEDGFAISARTVSEYVDQARNTYNHLKLYRDDAEATSSVLLAEFADHVLESQKDDSDHIKRYFFEDRWRSAIIKAFEKSEQLQNRPAVVIVYALAWNLTVVKALSALDAEDVKEHAASCGALVGLHNKMLQIKAHAGLQTSTFVQDNIAQYKRVAEATQCQELLKLVSDVANALTLAAIAEKERQERQEKLAKQPKTEEPSAVPVGRFGLYAGAGGSFAQPSALTAEDLSGQVAFNAYGGGLVRLFSVFHRNRLEYSLLAGLGLQWHHAVRILNPHIDFGMRLRVGLPVGIALTVLYAPGMLVDLPPDTESRFALSWSVLKAQLAVFVHWFAIGIGWGTDLRTLTASPAPAPAPAPADGTASAMTALALPGHSLSGFIELFY